MPQIGEIQEGCELGFRTQGKHIWHACETCGRQRWVQYCVGRACAVNKYCHHCGSRGDKNSRWKGGHLTNKQGYVLVKLQPNDFFYGMARYARYVLEHRLVMAKYLNRCLLPWEIVHHKNGIRNDNRLENLELLPASKYHLVDAKAQSLITALQKQIGRLEVQNRLLKERLNPKKGSPESQGSPPGVAELPL